MIRFKDYWKVLVVLMLLLLVFLFLSATESNANTRETTYTEEEIAAALNSLNERHITPAMVPAYYKTQNTYQLPAFLLIAISQPESHFKIGARGDKGKSWGVMQVGTMGRKHCKEVCGEMKTAEEEIMCGGCWFNHGLEMCNGNITKALSAYGCGKCKPTTLQAARGVRLKLKIWKGLHKKTIGIKLVFQSSPVH